MNCKNCRFWLPLKYRAGVAESGSCRRYPITVSHDCFPAPEYWCGEFAPAPVASPDASPPAPTAPVAAPDGPSPAPTAPVAAPDASPPAPSVPVGESFFEDDPCPAPPASDENCEGMSRPLWYRELVREQRRLALPFLSSYLIWEDSGKDEPCDIEEALEALIAEEWERLSPGVLEPSGEIIRHNLYEFTFENDSMETQAGEGISEAIGKLNPKSLIAIRRIRIIGEINAGFRRKE